MSKQREAPSARYLTHPFASFYGCTLNEMFLILGVYAVIEMPVMLILAGFLSKYVHGYLGALLLVFLVMAPVTFFVLLKKTAIKIGRLRIGKPPGFLMLNSKKQLHQYFGMKIEYITPKGRWCTKRTMK